MIMPHISPDAIPPLVARVMVKRRISDIVTWIVEFQARHDGQFPTTRSPFLRPGDSWNAIDGALRRDAIVQCPQFMQLKAALKQRKLTPNLARLNPAYVAPRTRMRRFEDILRMVQLSCAQHGGVFPRRSDPFDVRGYDDTWTAIDSALIEGAIADCPLWRAHNDRMAALGVVPSLASLNPQYRPRRRGPRTLAVIKSEIVLHMAGNAGTVPNQRSRFPAGGRQDSWKAICNALRSAAVTQDSDWTEFCARLDQAGQKPSLFTLIDRYFHELREAYESVA